MLQAIKSKYLQISLLFIFGWFGLALFNQVHAARFYFSPANSAFIEGCTVQADLRIDTQGSTSNAADIEINFDPTKLEIVDADNSLAGIQIGKGDAYELYFGNIVNNGTGNIKLAGGTFSQPLVGDRRFAFLRFRSKAGATSASFNINYTGNNTLDSNIAEDGTGLDLLTSVTNGSFTFSTGNCIPDTTGPTVTFVSPTNGQNNVPANGDIQFTISDAESDIDISSLQLTINNVVYTATSLGMTISGSGKNYTVTMAGANHVSLTPDNFNAIGVSVKDSKGNTGQRNISVNQPGDTFPPAIQFTQPSSNLGTHPEGQPIVFEIIDTGSGVDLSTLEIKLNGVTIPVTGPVVTTSGNQNQYIVTIQNYTGLINGKANLLEVRVADFSGNVRQGVLGANVCAITDDEVFNDGRNPITNGGQTLNICVGGQINVPREGVVRDIVNQVGPNGAIASIGILGLLLSLLPWLGILNIPTLLVNFFGVLLRRKSTRAWGMVYDKATFKPLALTTIRLYTAGTNNLVAQTVSDMDGRYRLIASQGKYRIETARPGYNKYTVDVEVRDQGENLSINLPLVTGRLAVRRLGRIESMWVPIWNYLRELFWVARPMIMIIGFIFSLLALSITGGWLNALIVSMYLLLFIVSLIIYFRTRRFGIITDSQSGYAIPSASIKFYQEATMQVVDTQVANASGQFDFYGDPGVYLVYVTAWGYNFPSEQQHDLEFVDRGFAKFVRLNLTRGRNKINIMLDPRTGQDLISKVQAGSNLQSPADNGSVGTQASV